MAGRWLLDTSKNVSPETASPSASSSPTVGRSLAGTGIRLPDQLTDQRPKAQQPEWCTSDTDLMQQVPSRCEKLCWVLPYWRRPLQPSPAR